ncbi:MAG: cyclic nucleotide-binding domain-containing protein [Panacagrimonas sp.]
MSPSTSEHSSSRAAHGHGAIWKPRVETARSARDLHDAFRFRYRIYIEEMKMPLLSANHHSKTVRDDADEHAITYLSRDRNGDIIATARTVIGNPGVAAETASVFDLDKFVAFFDHSEISFTGRLAIHPAWRRSPILRHLCEAIYGDLITAGVKLDFIVCTPGLVRLYQAFGYRQHRNAIAFDDLGYRIPMVSFLADIGYLRRIRSPLVPHPVAAACQPASTPIYADVFPGQSAPFETRGSECTRDLEQLTATSAGGHERLLTGLTEQEIRILLTRFQVLRPALGDPVVMSGTVGDELFYVIEGEVSRFDRSDHGSPALEKCRRGSFFGEREFLVDEPRSMDCVVTDRKTRLLVIDRSGFESLAAIFPRIRSIIAENMLRQTASSADPKETRRNPEPGVIDP